MSIWEFAVVMGCGVVGFWLVSILIEAFGAKPAPPDRRADESVDSQAPK
jgi:hypothetical protein